MTAKNSNPEHHAIIAHFVQQCEIKTYPAKTTLIHLGQMNETLFYIIKGSVVVASEDNEGKELVLAYLSKNDFFGEIGFFDNLDARLVNVRTRVESKIAQIDHKKFQNLLQNENQKYAASIMYMLTEQMANRLLTTNRNFRDLAFMDAEKRIIRTLLDLCKEPDAMTHPDGMQLHISRQEIGHIVGCSRELVGRVLKELEQKKMISGHGKTIVVFGTR